MACEGDKRDRLHPGGADGEDGEFRGKVMGEERFRTRAALRASEGETGSGGRDARGEKKFVCGMLLLPPMMPGES